MGAWLGKKEEEKTVGLSYCKLWVGWEGGVGGWDLTNLRDVDDAEFVFLNES